VLLAVIFRCENAPDSQTGHEAGISQNSSAVFSRICAIWGSGTLYGMIVSDGEVVQVNEQVLLPVLWGILDPGKQVVFFISQEHLLEMRKSY
jgi:hypothetical protein